MRQGFGHIGPQLPCPVELMVRPQVDGEIARRPGLSRKGSSVEPNEAMDHEWQGGSGSVSETGY